MRKHASKLIFRRTRYFNLWLQHDITTYFVTTTNN